MLQILLNETNSNFSCTAINFLHCIFRFFYKSQKISERSRREYQWNSPSFKILNVLVIKWIKEKKLAFDQLRQPHLKEISETRPHASLPDVSLFANFWHLFVNLFLFDFYLAIHIYIYTTNLNRIYKWMNKGMKKLIDKFKYTRHDMDKIYIISSNSYLFHSWHHNQFSHRGFSQENLIPTNL